MRYFGPLYGLQIRRRSGKIIGIEQWSLVIKHIQKSRKAFGKGFRKGLASSLVVF